MLTDAGLMALARGCSRLQCLTLRRCKIVTDEGIVAIAQHCQHLCDLMLRRLPLVTVAALHSIAQQPVRANGLHIRFLWDDDGHETLKKLPYILNVQLKRKNVAADIHEC